MKSDLCPKPCIIIDINMPIISPIKNHGNNSKKSITYPIFVESWLCCIKFITNGMRVITPAINCATIIKDKISPLFIRFSLRKTITCFVFKLYPWVFSVQGLFRDLASLILLSEETRSLYLLEVK